MIPKPGDKLVMPDGQVVDITDVAMPQSGTGGISTLVRTGQASFSRNHFLEIVSKCPTCGAPVYGHKAISVKDETPEVRYSCECRNKE